MKALQLALVVLAVLFIAATPALAQAPNTAVFAGPSAGAGIVIIGAGIGFGWIGASALQSMARQPEIAGRIQTAMIVIAALLEGATFFGLIVCIIKPF
jgi:F-type H+-transporting ATPase subunit c